MTQAGNPNGPGSENNPYTVAEARAAIDAGTGLTGVYATGIVSAIPTEWNTQYNNITFNFVDNSGDTDFLQAYRCVSGTGIDASEVAVGDIVVVTGNLTKYGSTYEFASGCTIVSLTHPTTPTITTSPSSLTGFTYIVGNGPSAAQSITLDGSNLTDDLTAAMNDNSDFEYSFDEDDGYFSNNLSTDYVPLTIYVRLKAGLAVGDYNGTITLTSTGAPDVTVNLSGSVTAPAAPSVTWDLSTDQTATATTDEMTWTSTYATMAVNKASAGTNANNYYPGTEGHSYTSTRFYKNSVLTITPAAGYNITSVVFEATTSDYATALKNSTWTNATAAVSGMTVTVTPTDVASAVSAAIGGTCGFTSVKVYYAAAAPSAPVWAFPTDVSTTLGGNDVVLTISDYVNGNPKPAITLTDTTADAADFDFDENDGSFTFIPSATGLFDFTFTATNSEGSKEATLTVTVEAPPASIVVSETTINIAADQTTDYVEIPVTYTNFTNVVAHVQFFDADENPLTSNPNNSWITVGILSNNVAYKILTENTDSEPRKTYCKVVANDDTGNAVYSDLITITQAGYVDPNAPGTENNPYTVAQAIAFINTLGTATSSEDVYVSGIISQVDSYNSTYKSITYWISDDGTTTTQMEVYSGKGLNSADFSAKEDLLVGDEVTVKGKVKLFTNNSGSTPEFDKNNYLLAFNRPAAPVVPTITLAGASSNTLEFGATSQGGGYTIQVENYTGNEAVQLTYCDASGSPVTDNPYVTWFHAYISGSGTTVSFSIDAENDTYDARYGYLKLYIADGGTTYYSDLITVKQLGQTAPDYATLPFNWAGGAKAGLLAMTGVTANSLGTDYAESNAPYRIKFDGTGDYIQVKTNERPGVVTIGVKMVGGAGSSSFTVQGSADGTTFTDVETLGFSGASNEELTLTTTNEFAETDRYVRLYFNKSVNVGVGPISIATYTAPSTDPVINASDVSIEADATEGEIAYTITRPVTGVTLTAASNDVWIGNINVDDDKVTFNCDPNTDTTERTATITLSYQGAVDKEITVTQGAYVAPFTPTTYTLATAITSGKHYIIVGYNDNDAYQAMGAQKSNNRAAVDVTVANDQATVSTADVKEVVICGPTTDGLYTIYDANENGFLYAASSSSNNLKTEAAYTIDGVWEITIDASSGIATIVAEKSSNRNVMQYNSGSTLFSCYATASQKPVYLYEKDSDTPVAANYTRTATVGNYGTICLPNNATIAGAELYSIAGVDNKTAPTALNLTEVYVAQAGVPYIFKATASTISAYYTGDAATTAGDANGLIGSFTKESITDANGDPITATENPYVLKNNKVCKAGVNVSVGANKAYINLNDVPTSTGSSPVKMFIDTEADGIRTMDNGQWTMDNAEVYDLAGRRVIQPRRGIYIVNGKKVLVK